MGEEILTTGAGAEERAIDQPVAWSARGNPAQMALLECSVFEVFFGGARGGGKTDGMLGEWANHADRYGKDAIGLMLRRTRTELIETIERSRAIYSLLGWKYNETEKMWRATNGARLRFAYLERDADADQYQGHSYTRAVCPRPRQDHRRYHIVFRLDHSNQKSGRLMPQNLAAEECCGGGHKSQGAATPTLTGNAC